MANKSSAARLAPKAVAKDNKSKTKTTKQSSAKRVSPKKAVALPEWNLTDLYASIDAPEVSRDLVYGRRPVRETLRYFCRRQRPPR